MKKRDFFFLNVVSHKVLKFKKIVLANSGDICFFFLDDYDRFSLQLCLCGKVYVVKGINSHAK